jgi:hypothetical protein
MKVALTVGSYAKPLTATVRDRGKGGHEVARPLSAPLRCGGGEDLWAGVLELSLSVRDERCSCPRPSLDCHSAAHRTSMSLYRTTFSPMTNASIARVLCRPWWSLAEEKEEEALR